MAISTNFGYDPYRDRYGMSEQEYYERMKYEEMKTKMMREAQMSQSNPSLQYLQEIQAQPIQAPQENKTLLLL